MKRRKRLFCCIHESWGERIVRGTTATSPTLRRRRRRQKYVPLPPRPTTIVPLLRLFTSIEHGPEVKDTTYKRNTLLDRSKMTHPWERSWKMP